MTDAQILDNLKNIIDACFAAGMVKRIEDCRGLLLLYDTLHDRLTQPNNTSP